MTRAAAALFALATVAGCADEADPIPELLATADSSSYSLAADGDGLYWGGSAGARILSFDEGTVDAIDGDEPALGVAVSGERLFWTSPHALMTAGADGSDAHLLIDEQPCVFAMTADDSTVYWGSAVNGGVRSWNWKVQDFSRIASDEPNITGLALRDGRLYWSSGRGYVASARVDGTDRRVHADGQEWPRSVAVSRDWIYWLSSDGILHRTGVDGGPDERIARRGQTRGFGSVLAATDRGAYWISTADDDVNGAIYYVAAATREVELVAAADATSIAIDRGRLYWITFEGDVYGQDLR